jgi:cob(I)alamin adenosyltransferase
MQDQISEDYTKTKGYVQVYTGNGKGKTTAALGLALRAAGAGYRVFIGQFVKGMRYSELETLTRLSDLITIRQYGRDCFINGKPTDEDRSMASSGLREIRKIVLSGDYRLIILDEANIAIYYNLFSIEELLDLIRTRPEYVELVITGRDAHPSLLEEADLVTEMREVKHYYLQGVVARKGIEK